MLTKAQFELAYRRYLEDGGDSVRMGFGNGCTGLRFASDIAMYPSMVLARNSQVRCKQHNQEQGSKKK
jgi:hypothetical protein